MESIQSTQMNVIFFIYTKTLGKPTTLSTFDIIYNIGIYLSDLLKVRFRGVKNTSMSIWVLDHLNKLYMHLTCEPLS